MITVKEIHTQLEKDKQVLLDMLSEMVQTESITCNEYEVGQVYKKWVEVFGFDAEIIEKEEHHPNVFATWTGLDGPNFVYNGHLDTLPVPNPEMWEIPPFSGQVSDGFLHGRGACDMKGANAAFLMAMKLLRDLGFVLKGSVQAIYTCDEQIGGGRGAKYLSDNGLIKGTYGINGESTCHYADGTIKLLTKHKGAMHYTLRITGKSYAASFSGKDKFLEQTGIDALEKAYKVMTALYEFRDTTLKQRYDKYLGCSVLGVTSLHAGEAVNLIAGDATLTIDRRFNPGETCESVTKELVDILEKIKREDPEFVYELTNTSAGPVLDIPEDNPLIQAIADAHREVRGKDIEFEAVCWGTDATLIADKVGMVMPVLGPGDTNHIIHNEKLALDTLFDVTEIYALTILKMMG